MTSQLQQVALTYLTRRWLWLVAGIAGVGFGPLAALSFFGPSSRRLDGSEALAVVGVATALVAFVVATQAKWQFCNPRARLLPGFSSPHIATLLALVVAGCGLYPLTLVLAGHWSLLGVPACSITLAASIIWGLHRPHWIAFVTGMASFLSLITPVGIDFWIKADHARLYAPAHLAILVAGWGAIAYWIHRLKVVREEDADYAIPIQAQQGAATRIERTQASRALGQQLARGSRQARVSDRWHDRLANMHATTIAGRKRLLRYGFTPSPLWINALWLPASFFSMMLLVTQFGVTKNADPATNLQTIWMMVLMPALMAGGMLPLRRPRMAQEFLLPMRRADYLNGILATIAINALILWFTSLAALLGMIAVIMPDRMFLGFVAAVTALSTGVHVYAFGVLCSIARMTSGGARLAASMIVVIPAMVALMLSTHNLPRPAVSPAQIEQRVQEEYHTTYEKYEKSEAVFSPEVKAAALNDRRESIRQRLVGPTPQAYVPWLLAGVLTIAGLAAFLDGRKRWLNLELG
jgi:hypothetical protein